MFTTDKSIESLDGSKGDESEPRIEYHQTKKWKELLLEIANANKIRNEQNRRDLPDKRIILGGLIHKERVEV